MRLFLISLMAITALSGCTVLAVADAVGSLAVGTVKVVGKGVGAVVSAAIPDGEDEKKAEPEPTPTPAQ